ncbi:MAG: thioesterase family protein [Pyrinomonadaceae bacterium]
MIEIQRDFPVRPYDVDASGAVGSISYVRWLEDLRAELFQKSSRARILFERNLSLTLARTELDYRAALQPQDQSSGHMQLLKIGRSSATFYTTFRNRDNILVAEARQVCVFVDAATRKPVPLPDEVRSLLEG